MRVQRHDPAEARVERLTRNPRSVASESAAISSARRSHSSAKRVLGRTGVLVAPAGFEPAISALRGLRPRPLDDGATLRDWWAALGLNQ